MPSGSGALLEVILALVVVVDLAVRHDAAVLDAAIAVCIDDPKRRLVLILRLCVFLPLGLALLARPEDRVLPQDGAVLVAIVHAPIDVVAAVVFMRVAALAPCELDALGLRFGVVRVDDEFLGGRFVGLRFAGDCILWIDMSN